MVLGYTWVIEDGSAANLFLEIGILVQTGVLILSASINPTQSCTGLSLYICAYNIAFAPNTSSTSIGTKLLTLLVP